MKMILSILTLVVVIFAGQSSANEQQNSFNWKELRDDCKANHESDECQQLRKQVKEFCAENPDNKRCHKLHVAKECRTNPDLEKCQEYKQRIKHYCEQHTGEKKCIRAMLHKVCKDDSESQECITGKQEAREHFCEKHPVHERCN